MQLSITGMALLVIGTLFTVKDDVTLPLRLSIYTLSLELGIRVSALIRINEVVRKWYKTRSANRGTLSGSRRSKRSRREESGGNVEYCRSGGGISGGSRVSVGIEMQPRFTY